MRPKVLVFSGYGLNCEEETKHAFDLAGARADIVHVNDLIAGYKKLSDFQILAFPGGFSYGDDTGSGNAYANKVRNHLWPDLKKFIARDTLTIGICNGFQILVSLGLVPALRFKYGNKQANLLHNTSARYINRWVDVQVTNHSPWLKNIDSCSLVIAHGEGKFYADERTLNEMKKKNLVALRYYKGEICDYQKLAANPTGTLDDICGITDESGKIFGLMPHPERAMFFTHLPNWPLLKEKYLRDKRPLPQYAPGLQIFRNAVAYFTKR